MTISNAVGGNLTTIYLVVIAAMKAYGLAVGRSFGSGYVLVLSTAVVAAILMATLVWDVSRKATQALMARDQSHEFCRGGICWHGVAAKSPASEKSIISCSSIKPGIDFEYLESKYKRCGVRFTGIGDAGCVLRMELENGSAAKLMLPSGLITSVKAQMWHGGTTELLHTSVVEQAGNAVIRGGLSLALSCETVNEDDVDAGIIWSPHFWSLHQVTGTPQESIQVELISTSVEGDVGFKHIVTLERDSFSSEILVSNSSTCSSVHLVGSTICHLAVSTPDATYAIGLEGSDYFVRPPFQGNFSIIPPDFTKSTQQNPYKFWPFNTANDTKQEVEESSSGEEDDNYKHLTQKSSRIYTSAPRSLTIIDRGRRNSVRVRRKGFKEVYMLSPGSEHELYNKYSYICIGHGAQLEPVILDPQTEWSGGLQLFNPNY